MIPLHFPDTFYGILIISLWLQVFSKGLYEWVELRIWSFVEELIDRAGKIKLYLHLEVTQDKGFKVLSATKIDNNVT